MHMQVISRFQHACAGNKLLAAAHSRIFALSVVSTSICSSSSSSSLAASEGHVMSQILLGLVPMNITNDVSQPNFNRIDERMEAWLAQTIALGAVHDDLLRLDSDLFAGMVA